MKSSHALLAFGAAICLATTCSLSAYASPLKNYDAGKVAIDAGITLPSSLKGDNYKFSKSNKYLSWRNCRHRPKNCFKLQME